MFVVPETAGKEKSQFYIELINSAQLLLTGETDLIAQAANLSALIWYTLPNINWAGFYFYKDKEQGKDREQDRDKDKGKNRDKELVLGPFQGKPACIRIASGKGVCGTAFESGETLRVDDVHAFPGHIACDPDSRSELVIPLFYNKQCIGVLDIDSQLTGRFTEEDQTGLEKIIRLLENHITYP